MIQNRKDQILKALENFYISPLTEISAEIEILKRVIAKRPFRVQIAMPASWKMARYLPTTMNLTHDEALARLQLFVDYFSGSKRSVFDHQSSLNTGSSFPYFEWRDGAVLQGINALLGELRLIYLYRGNEDAALEFFTFLQEINLFSQLVVVGSALTENIESFLRGEKITIINDIEETFWDPLVKNRSLPQLSLTTFFHTSTDLLLMSAKGCYLKSYSRTEFMKQYEQIQQEYFVDLPIR
ncbi:hypothetical protein [Ignatzschineria cameli]|uniref:Uncharacterized protein n=1 Tax=Ignatzschineria cameli TaxID=2182793 RepID=A0A2U2ASZ0_9GAMM|nr:hypothetical protein [Ignatzschineria cameli]PWD85931.1 hypothetical protein DC080_04000 [Ignatzschineria cameli]PWD87860.1 hypothetical protein DC077_00835 [Ignatzschineria cameli]PWD90428.1 hypothetical protein DC079_04625 [Ignatzschineria cameli]PWD92312.1 hypothetical protein DC081_04335 [Ignatzschineria cameli]PWD93105.1 hypothetical protein DC078_04625 [Ignatzschineria cameli]